MPSDFPSFVRQGYDIKIMADGYDIDEKGLIYKVHIAFCLVLPLHGCNLPAFACIGQQALLDWELQPCRVELNVPQSPRAAADSSAACLLQDFEQGSGPRPEDGQQVTFDYTAYNENGNRIDSSYKQGRPAMTRLGINGLIPGMQSHPQKDSARLPIPMWLTECEPSKQGVRSRPKIVDLTGH